MAQHPPIPNHIDTPVEPETIQLPPVTTGIDLSAGAIQLLSFCIANCPLTEKQRADLSSEWVSAIRNATEAMTSKGPNRITDTADGLH